MKAVTAIGFLLIFLGIVGLFAGHLIFPGKAIERGLGPLRVKHQQTITVPIQPVLSGLVMLSGMAMVVVGAQKSS